MPIHIHISLSLCVCICLVGLLYVFCYLYEFAYLNGHYLPWYMEEIAWHPAKQADRWALEQAQGDCGYGGATGRQPREWSQQKKEIRFYSTLPQHCRSVKGERSQDVYCRQPVFKNRIFNIILIDENIDMFRSMDMRVDSRASQPAVYSWRWKLKMFTGVFGIMAHFHLIVDRAWQSFFALGCVAYTLA